MTLHWGSLERAFDHAAELARASGRRQHLQICPVRSRLAGRRIWKITDTDLKNVPEKART